MIFRFIYGILHKQSARWSSGQDASLSRWKRGFDSPTGHHNTKDALWRLLCYENLYRGESNAALRKRAGGSFLAVTEDFCKSRINPSALMTCKNQERFPSRDLYLGGIERSVKKTSRGLVFSGDRRFLQVTYKPISTYDLQKSRTIPLA